MAAFLYRLIGTHTPSLITSHLLKLAHLGAWGFLFLSFFCFVVVAFFLLHKKTKWEASNWRHKFEAYEKKETKESKLRSQYLSSTCEVENSMRKV